MYVCMHVPGFDGMGKGWVCSASKGERNVHLPEVVAVIVVVVVVEKDGGYGGGGSEGKKQGVGR
jgi:hypothetical protein